MVKRYEPGEEVPELGGGGGGGCGGGGPGGGVQADCTAQFDLSCDTPVTRGSTATCEVTTTDLSVGLDSITFNWIVRDTVRSSGQGPNYASWSGVATSARTISVEVLSGTRVLAQLDTNVDVEARSWRYFALNAPVVYGGLGWSPGKWGENRPQVHQSGTLGGSGPWAGEYTMASPPGVSNVITLHADLDSIIGPAYPGVNAISCAAGVGSSANLVMVNGACGLALSTWEGRVLSHERAHEASANRCLQSLTTAARMLADVEALVGAKAIVVGDMQDRWRPFQQLLDQAFEGRVQGVASPTIWEHRRLGSWSLGPISSTIARRDIGLLVCPVSGHRPGKEDLE